MKVYLEFHDSGAIKKNTNATFFALVSKGNQISTVADFKPISLIARLYKVTAKVPSLCIRKILHETILWSQGAFVEGRQILDAVLVANEVVDEKRRYEKFGVVFKIDFGKACDLVKWPFWIMI